MRNIANATATKFSISYFVFLVYIATKANRYTHSLMPNF